MAMAIFLLMKAIYSAAALGQLHFLLYPTSQIIDALTGTGSIFLSAKGYHNPELQILINKSCSGFNFWALCFMMTYCLLEKRGYGMIRNLVALPITLLFTYLFTLLVNSTRILFSIFLHAERMAHLTLEMPWSHQAEGIFIYLSYLIIAYLSLDYFQTRKTVQL